MQPGVSFGDEDYQESNRDDLDNSANQKVRLERLIAAKFRNDPQAHCEQQIRKHTNQTAQRRRKHDVPAKKYTCRDSCEDRCYSLKYDDSYHLATLHRSQPRQVIKDCKTRHVNGAEARRGL